MVDVVSRVALVLLVEDEQLTSLAIEDVLRTAGFEPVAALNDRDAYAALGADGAPFDALVVDINLGEGTTGFDVARFARRMNPGVPVIYLSGGSPDSVTAFGVKDAGFIAKPFEDSELIETLNRMIRRPGGDGAANHMPMPA